jgi:HK97 family phage portal protein
MADLRQTWAAVKQFFTPKKRASSNLTKPQPWLLLDSESGMPVSENSALSIASLLRAMSLVGNILGSMPVAIQETRPDGSLKKRPYHPLLTLLDLEPHPHYSKGDFMMALATQLTLRQNFVAHIQRDRMTGRPNRLKIIEWSRVYDIVEDRETGELVYLTEDGQNLPGRDVLHIKGVTRSGLVGEDTLLRQRDTIGGDLASKNQANKIYRNGTKLSGYVSTDQALSATQIEEYAKYWQMNYAGSDNAGATPFLGGGMRYHPISLTPQEAELLETRRYNVYEIARMTGVPPRFLFAMGTNEVVRLEEMSGLLMRFTIAPLVERVEQEMNRKLFNTREKGRVRVNFDMDYYLRADAEGRAKLYETLFKIQSINPNEIREREGMNPREGGDEYGLPFASNISEDSQGAGEQGGDNEQKPVANGKVV